MKLLENLIMMSIKEYNQTWSVCFLTTGLGSGASVNEVLVQEIRRQVIKKRVFVRFKENIWKQI